MRVFVTGASGHVGSAVVPALHHAGHQVIGLARSEAAAAKLDSWGADVRHGDIEDLDVLRSAASEADAVIHLAFRHDLMQSGQLAEAGESDLAATRAMAEVLAGTGKAFVGTTGTALLSIYASLDRPVAETDTAPGGYRVDVENLIIGLADQNVRSSVVRLPPTVHSYLDKHGFVPGLISMARAHGRAGYPGDGTNRWPAVHTLDAADLYVKAVESAPAGSRLHAVADEGVPFRDLAAAIGRGLDVPVAAISEDKSPEFFGFLAQFVTIDNPTSSQWTRQTLNWTPTRPGLIDDLADRHYFEQ